MSLSVDLAPPRTRPVWEPPDVIAFPQQIVTTGHPDESPAMRVISYDDTLAHKVSGMFTHGVRTVNSKCSDCVARGDGLFNCQMGDLPYRAQDLVDVIMIILSSSWDGPATHAMLHEEFKWRIEQHEELKVPPAFEIPNPEWFSKFEGYARTTPGLPYGDLGEAVPVVRAFLDPLLSEQPPPPSRWDPDLRTWITAESEDAPHADDDTVAATGPEGVRRLPVPTDPPASTVHADPRRIAQWDELSAGRLDEELQRIKDDPGLSPAQKLDHVISRVMYHSAYAQLTRIPGPDNENFKHLRFYSHQRGELYSHAAALMADPDLTIEIAYMAERGINNFQWDAYQGHVAYLGELPEGVEAHHANTAALRRLSRGESPAAVDPATLVDDLVDLQAQPLRDALRLRERLIDDYGIEPHRIRLAYAGSSMKSHYGQTQWMRAQLLALRAIQADPDQARQRMVDRMLGPDEAEAERRRSRAQAVVDRLLAANGQADEFALLWVRDTRGQPVGSRHGPHLDTRPEVLRQTIEALRAEHPGRRIVLLGDDVFAGRPGLEEEWRRAGALDGVDTRTLVEFWDDPRNDGGRLTYGEQALFFHLLNTQRDVIQLGMESGALEIPAMLGVPTVYFEAREHDGNKGNRWMLYWQSWAYGEARQLRDAFGNPRFDRLGRPIMTFDVSETAEAPLPAMRRVLFGPDLPDPDNRRGQPVAVYHPARVAVTMDRINRLAHSGEMDRWPERLGRSVEMRGAEWTPWSDSDWERSKYYAEQLRRWLRTDARTPDEIGQKWLGIRLALQGVLEPGFTKDQEYEGVSLAHPYAVLHVDRSRLDNDAIRIDHAYRTTDPDERAAAVTRALKFLLATEDITRQALDDLRAFQLDQSEIDDLRAAVRDVTTQPRTR
ncbi:hypothetical protein ITP53_49750 [Nonomuraea sp. K274]|uniref:Uncharacterized protein n=2 Tax=Nonomuraea cypriaca TaxID=1187855 RepID=A0A931AII5_9ACTN|nr:hypothetical protein [Nonomuraea cypriaca]